MHVRPAIELGVDVMVGSRATAFCTRATRTLGLAVAMLLSTAALAADRNVSSAQAIADAFASASAGDRIIIAPGEYGFSNLLRTQNNGPVTVTTTQVGAAKLNFNSEEGLVIYNADWTIEKVWVNGVCAGEACGAGVHVKPTAHRFTLTHARVSNFGQHVKASREASREVEDAQILSSHFWNDGLRPENGTTPMDLVGGKRWRIIGNYVHDYGGDDGGDYGIFLKGVTSDGLIERNLVICARDNPRGGATLGISFGGGGTGSQFCPNQDCSCEDHRSIARNNIVLHCTDFGLHTKRACGSKFYNNTVYDVGGGIQLQEAGAGAPVEIRNNVVAGGISGPQAAYSQSSNLLDAPASTFENAYADPSAADFRTGADPSALRNQGTTLADVTTDYCGTQRTTPDLGAIEFPSTCNTWPWTGDIIITPPTDAGVPDTGGVDSGSSVEDASTPPDASTPSDSGAAVDSGSSSPDAGRADSGASRPDADSSEAGPSTDGAIRDASDSSDGGQMVGATREVEGGCACHGPRPRPRAETKNLQGLPRATPMSLGLLILVGGLGALHRGSIRRREKGPTRGSAKTILHKPHGPRVSTRE